MRDIMFDIPSNEKIEKCIITRDTVLNNKEKPENISISDIITIAQKWNHGYYGKEIIEIAKKICECQYDSVSVEYSQWGERYHVEFLKNKDKFKALGQDIAMQIAAYKPLYLNREEVPAEAPVATEEVPAEEAKAESNEQ